MTIEALLKRSELPVPSHTPHPDAVRAAAAPVTHLMRQKKDFSCMHSVGEDSE